MLENARKLGSVQYSNLLADRQKADVVTITLENLSDEALKAKTAEFKERLANGETLDDILVEAFAVVREGSKRVYGKRPFDVQLMGAIIFVILPYT